MGLRRFASEAADAVRGCLVRLPWRDAPPTLAETKEMFRIVAEFQATAEAMGGRIVKVDEKALLRQVRAEAKAKR